MSQNIKDLYDSILAGNADLAKEKVQVALDAGDEPGEILNKGMIAAMAEVGDRFERGEYFVPEMLIAARAMQTGVAVLKPHLQP